MKQIFFLIPLLLLWSRRYWIFSGSSVFSKPSFYIWNSWFMLKHSLKDFEYNLTSMWNECNCMVIWTFFGIHFPEIRLLAKRISCSQYEYKQHTQHLQYLQSGLLWCTGPLTEGMSCQKLSSWNLLRQQHFCSNQKGWKSQGKRA